MDSWVYLVVCTVHSVLGVNSQLHTMSSVVLKITALLIILKDKQEICYNVPAHSHGTILQYCW